MPSNKNRLYIALYPSGGQRGTEEEKSTPVPGVRYHVRNLPVPGYPYGKWVYEAVSLMNVQQSVNLLARVIIGKIEDVDRLIGIIESVPVIQNNPNWRCRSWVANVVNALAKDGKALGTAELNWPKTEATAREYVGKKAAAGRYKSNITASNPAASTPKPMPTWDLLAKKEIFP